MLLAKIAVSLQGGGYFFVLSLFPMVYPSPKAVSTRLNTAINPSIVIIRIALLSVKSLAGFYGSEGYSHEPSEEGGGTVHK